MTSLCEALPGVCGPFAEPFMQRALAAGLITVLATSIIGTWVVLRGLGFMSDALAHGVLPGIALASIANFNLLAGAVVGAVVMIGGIAFIHARGSFSEDTGIALLFVGMLALGVLIISRSPSFAGDLTGFLFGEVLAVSTSDLVTQLVVAGLVVSASIVFYRPFVALSFNEAKAAALGMKPRLANFLMLALLTLSIVASFRTVGTLLVFGLIVAPPATATLLTRSVPRTMVVSFVIGSLAVIAGLLSSWYLETAPGASISLVAVISFFVVLVIPRRHRAIAR